MGWLTDDGTHEGYLVAMVPDDDAGGFNGHVPSRLRELSARSDGAGTARLPVRWVRVACACGWRSPLLYAPHGTEFVPSICIAPDAFEDQCGELWLVHVATTGRAPDGGCSIGALLAAAKSRTFVAG